MSCDICSMRCFLESRDGVQEINSAAPLTAMPHLASILRASSWVSDEVGGNLSFRANGRQASMIAFEWEVTPAVFFSDGIRGSSAELHALRIISICSDGSQRVAAFDCACIVAQERNGSQQGQMCSRLGDDRKEQKHRENGEVYDALKHGGSARA